MRVKIRPYRRGGCEADVRVTHPDGRELRVRKKTPCTGKSAATRWAETVERSLLLHSLGCTTSTSTNASSRLPGGSVRAPTSRCCSAGKRGSGRAR